jgi:hypothetical protein
MGKIVVTGFTEKALLPSDISRLHDAFNLKALHTFDHTYCTFSIIMVCCPEKAQTVNCKRKNIKFSYFKVIKPYIGDVLANVPDSF